MEEELTILTYGKSLSIPIVAAIALLPLKRPSISENNSKQIKVEENRRWDILPATRTFQKASYQRATFAYFNLLHKQHGSLIDVSVSLTTINNTIKPAKWFYSSEDYGHISAEQMYTCHF